MTEDRVAPNTGIDVIDKDYSDFVELMTEEHLAELQKLADEGAATTGDLFKIGTPGAFRLARSLVIDQNFEELKKLVSADSVKQLNDARERAKVELLPILEAPALKPLVLDLEDSKNDSDVSLAAAALDRVTTVSAFSSWVFEGESVFPAIRVLLGNRDKKLLLDSTMEWDDVLFIVRILISEVADDIERLRRTIAVEYRPTFGDDAEAAFEEKAKAIKRDLDRGLLELRQVLEAQSQGDH